jgi:TPR repeat protein
VAFYLGLHFESEKRHPNFRKTRSPIVENPAWVKNGYLRTGSRYVSGIGVPQNYTEAAKWFRKAADQGNNGSQAHLGDMYSDGRGVSKDKIEAYAWYNISAASNSTDLARYAKNGMSDLKLTFEETTIAQKRSTELFNEIEARKKAASK